MSTLIQNLKAYWKFHLSFASIITFIAVGLYMVAVMLFVGLWFITEINSTFINFNLNKFRYTMIFFIFSIPPPMFLLSWFGNFGERFKKYEVGKDEPEEDKKKDIFNKI